MSLLMNIIIQVLNVIFCVFCHNAECCYANIVLLGFIMLSIDILTVIMLSVIIMIVVLPCQLGPFGGGGGGGGGEVKISFQK
jgi:hypothetical protein